MLSASDHLSMLAVGRLPAIHTLLAPYVAGVLVEILPFRGLNCGEIPPSKGRRPGVAEQVVEKVVSTRRKTERICTLALLREIPMMRKSSAKGHPFIT